MGAHGQKLDRPLGHRPAAAQSSSVLYSTVPASSPLLSELRSVPLRKRPGQREKIEKLVRSRSFSHTLLSSCALW